MALVFVLVNIVVQLSLVVVVGLVIKTEIDGDDFDKREKVKVEHLI